MRDGPAAGAGIHRVDGLLGELETKLAAQELDRLGTREGELRRRDVEDGSRQAPPREAAELRRPPRREHQVGVLREQIDELVAERGEGSAAVNAWMVIDEERELAKGCELIRKGLRELPETTFQATPAIQKGHKVLPEFRRVAPQGTDEIGEQDERIFVAPLQR